MYPDKNGYVYKHLYQYSVILVHPEILTELDQIGNFLGLKKNNCDFDFYTDTTSVGITATKNIKKGDEFYISYGMDFWKEDRRYNLLNKRNKDYIDNRDNGIEI